MLKRIFSIGGLLTVSFLLLVGCSSCTINKIKASLGQEFILPVGQTAVINGENLTIKFNGVKGDSRCPKGVECIWAGEAKCQMQITYSGSTSEVIYTQPGGDVLAQDFFNQYKVNFQLEPYPEFGKQLVSTDYKLIMTITK